jgi:hypothetical protein
MIVLFVHIVVRADITISADDGSHALRIKFKENTRLLHKK